ncbi:MAG: hypothetical protein NTW03_06325 [Verrucomicrobia bacterium]|nr:hypothetical protein [Verrucomicrobiota bacterium]
MLLTHADGFDAQVSMESSSSSNRVEMISGRLLGQSGKLLFTPAAGAVPGKIARAARLSFLWDVTQNFGQLLSEGMQGYAPIVSSLRVTNVVAKAVSDRAGPQQVAGHPCLQEEAVIRSSDGAETVFQVWRATDLKGLPIRIQSASNSRPFTLTLTRVRLGNLPNEFFLPPDGFTKFSSPEAMMDELASRQQNAKRSKTHSIDNPDDLGGPEGHRTRPDH